jgi:hypothetical protein
MESNAATHILHWLNQLTNKSTKGIAEGAGATLKNLYIPWCTKIDSVGLSYFGGNVGHVGVACSQLETLDLGNCARINDKGLKALAAGCKRLRHINLENCDSVTDDGMSTLAFGCRKLNLVTLRMCVLIGDQSLIALGKFSKKMKSLNVYRSIVPCI